jgi:glycosyltransferase involved in cell wall biosynthesis
VSVGLPVFQGANYLREALDSLLAQDYDDFEIVLCDNASSDATPAICREYAERDARIRYHQNEVNLGAAANYNRVFELARGEYFKWAAHDDKLAPSHLRRCVEVLDAAPERVVLCYPQTLLIDAEGRELRIHPDRLDIRDPQPHARIARFMRYVGQCNPVMGLIRADALRRTGLIRRHIGSDMTLLAELVLQGELWEIPEPLFFRRIHELSSRQGRLSLAEVAAWFDPAARGSGRLPVAAQAYLHVMEVVWAAPLPLVERLLCVLRGTATWWTRRARVAGGRARRSLRGRLGRELES